MQIHGYYTIFERLIYHNCAVAIITVDSYTSAAPAIACAHCKCWRYKIQLMRLTNGSVSVYGLAFFRPRDVTDRRI